MQHKQKVTHYLSPELHRQLKIRAAVDATSMSTLFEKAIHFYLHHSDVVDEIEAQEFDPLYGQTTGKTYQVYSCPDCHSSFVIKDGQTVSLKNQPSFMTEEFSLEVAKSISSEDQADHQLAENQILL